MSGRRASETIVILEQINKLVLSNWGDSDESYTGWGPSREKWPENTFAEHFSDKVGQTADRAKVDANGV